MSPPSLTLPKQCEWDTYLYNNSFFLYSCPTNLHANGPPWSRSYGCRMQSVTITTKVVGSNLAHGEVYSIQHCVITFVSDLWQVGGCSL